MKASVLSACFPGRGQNISQGFVEVKTNQSHFTEHQRCVPGTAYQADTVFTLQVRRWRVRELA